MPQCCERGHRLHVEHRERRHVESHWVVKTTKQSSAAKTALKLEAPRRRRDGANEHPTNIVLRIAKETASGVLYARPVDAHWRTAPSIVFSVAVAVAADVGYFMGSVSLAVACRGRGS